MNINEQFPKVPPTATIDRGGQWVVLGGNQYKIPPLNFRAVRQYASTMSSLRDVDSGSSLDPEKMSLVAEIAHAAIVRNYPDMKLADIEDMLDLGNFSDVFSAIMNIAGLVKNKGEHPVGEATPSP